MTAADPFQSPGAFRAVFTDGLASMLRTGGERPALGVFILALANATYDPQLMRALRPDLERVYQTLEQHCRAALRGGQTLDDAPDDLMVFLKLLAVGFDGLSATEFRQAGPWRVQFNHLRAFRPPRMSRTVVNRLWRDFDPAGFHFDKPFLRAETFWEGQQFGRPARLLYNKFPFADLHGLLVLEPGAGKPQYLTAADHQHLWRWLEQLGERLPGIGMGYNSYGAYASVNHLHLQTYLGTADYPVEHASWRHNGGQQPYPVAVRCITDAAQAWEQLAAWQARDQAYNLLYRPGRVYLMPRRMQGHYAHADWTGGFAWSEMAGAITTFNRAVFEGLDAAAIEEEFTRLAS